MGAWGRKLETGASSWERRVPWGEAGKRRALLKHEKDTETQGTRVLVCLTNKAARYSLALEEFYFKAFDISISLFFLTLTQGYVFIDL